MKAQTKMIAASLVVIMLALSAVGGITYSWFSASDEADVNITTGIVDITTYGNVGELDTNEEGFKYINVTGFVPGQDIIYSYEVQNNSTIDIIYQWSIVLEQKQNVVAQNLNESLTINGSSMNADGEKLTWNSAWTKWAPSDNVLTGSFVIALNENWETQGISLEGTVKFEAYQGDYSTGDVTASVSNNNTATVSSSNISLNNTIQTGEFTDTVEDVGQVTSSIKFDTSSTENLVNKANGAEIVISVDKVEAPAPQQVADIPADLKLGIEVTVTAGTTPINNLGGTADVTIIVPGQYEGKNVQIWYLDSTPAELMPIVSVKDNNNDTSTIVFTTTHFSTFYLGEKEDVVATDYTTVTSVEELESALNSDDVSTIVLGKDISGNGIIVKGGVKKTVNFAGFRYTINGTLVGSAGTETNGMQLLGNGTTATSTLTFKNGIIETLDENGAKILIQNYSNLTLIDMNLIGSDDTEYVLSNNCGDTYILGNTSITAEGDNVAFDVCDFANYEKASVYVKTSGTITGDIELGKFADNGDRSLTIDAMDFKGKYIKSGNLENDIKLTINGLDFCLVGSADELVSALEKNKNVLFENDIKIDPANMSNAYGTTGINIKKGQTIDGFGYTLDIKGAGGTWDSGICTSGGEIKDLTVTGSFRGIFIKKDPNYNSQVILDGVTIEGTTYTISVDSGTGKGLIAKNSTFKGWTSYAATLGNAKFIDCTFGSGNGYNYSRPYAPTEYIDCKFEAGHVVDPHANVTFENCTFDDVPLTAENLSNLVSDTSKATVK